MKPHIWTALVFLLLLIAAAKTLHETRAEAPPSPPPGRPGPFYLAGAVEIEPNESTATRLVWEPALGAERYVVTLSTAKDFKKVYRQIEAETNYLGLRTLPPKHWFYWKVEAVGPDGSKRQHTGKAGMFRTSAHGSAAAEATVFRGKPTIDGTIREEEWRGAAKLTLGSFPIGSPKADFVEPTARLLWDEQALYIACSVQTPGGREPEARKDLPRDSSIWTEDSLEVFIIPADERTRQLILNAAGSIYDGLGGSQGWNGQWTSATSVTHGPTTIHYELAIPWADLGGKPKPRQEWKFNLCCDLNSQTLVPSWSDIERVMDFKSFGTITFTEKPHEDTHE
jgi:hypothetical protein